MRCTRCLPSATPFFQPHPSFRHTLPPFLQSHPSFGHTLPSVTHFLRSHPSFRHNLPSVTPFLQSQPFLRTHFSSVTPFLELQNGHFPHASPPACLHGVIEGKPCNQFIQSTLSLSLMCVSATSQCTPQVESRGTGLQEGNSPIVHTPGGSLTLDNSACGAVAVWLVASRFSQAAVAARRSYGSRQLHQLAVVLAEGAAIHAALHTPSITTDTNTVQVHAWLRGGLCFLVEVFLLVCMIALSIISWYGFQQTYVWLNPGRSSGCRAATTSNDTP